MSVSVDEHVLAGLLPEVASDDPLPADTLCRGAGEGPSAYGGNLPRPRIEEPGSGGMGN